MEEAVNMFYRALDAIGERFDRWLTKVGKENRPTDTGRGIYPEEEPPISRRDFMGDEKGDDWHV